MLRTLVAFFSVLAVSPAAEVTRGGLIPYFATGGGAWKTSFSILCLTQGGCDFALSLIGADGQPAVLPLTVTSGDDVADLTTSTVQVTAAAGVTTLIETSDSIPTLVTGAVDIASNSIIAGYSTFRQRIPGRPDFESTVPIENRVFSRAFSVAFDNREGFLTGISLTNITNDSPATVTVEAVDLANRTLFSRQITLNALNSAAFDLADRFPETIGKTGVLVFSTPGPYITGTAFRFNPTGPFTTLPIFNLR